MLRAEPVVADLSQAARCLKDIKSIFARATLAHRDVEWTRLALPDEIPASAHEVIPVTPENEDLARPILLADELPWRLPCLALVVDGRLASLCFSSRNTPVAAEAGVNTLEEFRGRGYAPAVVAVWARAVRAEGCTPLYSTSWDNLASRSVAGKLGLVLYGADLSIE